jgi:hypothetical protein
MAGATWKALVDYSKAKKCGCTPKWDHSWWSQIDEFIDAMERLLDREVTDYQLRQKIAILNVPWRSATGH